MKARGFTLIEAAVTLAIMAVVATAAVSSLVALQRLARDTGQQMIVNERLRAGLLYLADETRDAGGIGIQPWAAAIIEDDCGPRDGMPPCRGSDRLTVVQGIPTFPGCSIDEDLGGTVRLERVGAVDGRGGRSCCFRDNRSFVRQVAIVYPNAVEPVLVTGTGSGDCSFGVQRLLPASVLPRALPSSRERGVMVLADIKTFYVDWDSNNDVIGDLKMHIELNGDGDVENERLTILEDVADFQVAAGYRIDGRSPFESSTGAGDTWWYNGVGERNRPPAELPAEALNFIGLSIIATMKSDQSRQVATPWGPVRHLTQRRVALGTERTRIGED